ncbi:hypothetical protein ACQ4PT_061779 [Festuca glaucescens]
MGSLRPIWELPAVPAMAGIFVGHGDGACEAGVKGESGILHRTKELENLQDCRKYLERAPPAILFLLLIVDFGIAQNTTSKADEFHVGVILNLGSLVGKVARTSVSLALQDFYAVHPNYSTKLVLHIRDSMASDILAASAGLQSASHHWSPEIIRSCIHI